MDFKTKKQALEIVKGLSNPSKMPCHGYSLPAAACGVGSKLRKIDNSVCSKCYAHKGMYGFSNVQKALQRRLIAIRDPNWTDAMIYLIKDMPYFRFHDSGDIQDEQHLDTIFDVAEGCPNTKFWLPTREHQIVKKLLKKRSKPKNLIIRLSALMLEGEGPKQLARDLGVQISTVKSEGYSCPAHEQNNECKDCRKCWDGRYFDISYRLH